jgi:hypothetical protein
LGAERKGFTTKHTKDTKFMITRRSRRSPFDEGLRRLRRSALRALRVLRGES